MWKHYRNVLKLQSLFILAICSQTHLLQFKRSGRVILNEAEPVFLGFLWLQYLLSFLK